MTLLSRIIQEIRSHPRGNKIIVAVVLLIVTLSISYSVWPIIHDAGCRPDLSRVGPNGAIGTTCNPLKGTTVPGPEFGYTPQATP